MSDPGTTRPRHDSGARHQSRLLLAASILLSIGALVIVVGGVVASVTAEPDPLPPSATTARGDGVGLCLTADIPSGADHTGLVAAFEAQTVAMPHMFPQPFLDLESTTGSLDVTRMVAAVWPIDPATERVSEWRRGEVRAGCAVSPAGWTVRVTRDLLADGADRALAAADFSDDWTAVMEVELDPVASTVRTILHFSGPLNISGSCWIDDILDSDPETGKAVLTSVADDDAGIAGIVACRAFADSLPDGAAGEQALSLVPTQATLGDDSEHRLMVDSIRFTDDAIVIEGSFGDQLT